MGQLGDWPTTCAGVRFDLCDGSYDLPACEGDVGDLLWNPKGGDGHLLVAEAICNVGQRREEGVRLVDCGCGGWITPPVPEHTTLVCECGRDGSWRDHHYVLLARKPK